MTNLEAILAQIKSPIVDPKHRELLETILRGDCPEKIDLTCYEGELGVCIACSILFSPESIPIIWRHLKATGVVASWLKLFLETQDARLRVLDLRRVSIVAKMQEITVRCTDS